MIVEKNKIEREITTNIYVKKVDDKNIKKTNDTMYKSIDKNVKKNYDVVAQQNKKQTMGILLI